MGGGSLMGWRESGVEGGWGWGVEVKDISVAGMEVGGGGGWKSNGLEGKWGGVCRWVKDISVAGEGFWGRGLKGWREGGLGGWGDGRLSDRGRLFWGRGGLKGWREGGWGGGGVKDVSVIG